MTSIPIWHLNLLRAGYLLLVIGLGSAIWPQILDPAAGLALQRSVVVCMLGAMSMLALLGLRYPLRMLPLLFFELTWKTLWLARIALPAWTAHRLDAALTETAFECLIAIVFLFLIPWRYVFDRYGKAPGDPWRQAAAAAPVRSSPSSASART